MVLRNRYNGCRDDGEQASLTNSRHKSRQSNYFSWGGWNVVTEFVGKSLINKGSKSNEFVIPARR